MVELQSTILCDNKYSDTEKQIINCIIKQKSEVIKAQNNEKFAYKDVVIAHKDVDIAKKDTDIARKDVIITQKDMEARLALKDNEILQKEI